MIRYFATAACLKLFSLNETTRYFYRKIGNTFGSRSRVKKGLPYKRVNRAKLLLSLFRTYGLMTDSQRILEVGTGWIHFTGLFIRLFVDGETWLQDVWDNRQFSAFKKHFYDLKGYLDTDFDLNMSERERASQMLRVVDRARSFNDIYTSFNMKYVVDETGCLDSFPSNYFDVIFSFHVLEHVSRPLVPPMVANLSRVLKPGGIQIHLIGTSDHLAHYDPQVCFKNYIRYSNKVWKIFFENSVQYMNRIQPSEWCHLFRDSRCEILDERRTNVAVDGINIAKDFKKLPSTDWGCTSQLLVLKKFPYDYETRLEMASQKAS